MIKTNEEAIMLIQEINEDGWNVTSEHMEALDFVIKALGDATPIESITTKGGMTLSLKKN